MNKHRIRNLLLVVIVAIIIILFIILFMIGNKNNKRETVGLVIPGNKSEQGFNGAHYKGIAEACDKYNINLVVYENISESDEVELKKAVNEMHKQGIKLVFLCSFGYEIILRNEFDNYADMTFFGLGDISHSDNYNCYFARLYQSRYLSGIVAGMSTKTNSIGYVASVDNSEVRRGVNAFMLGIKKVNPDAVVNVVWTNSWDDKDAEIAGAQKLIKEAGVDVITYHANTSNTVDVAEEAGIYSICYNTPIDEKYSDNVLMSVTADWQKMYEQIIRDFFLNSAPTKTSYWLGIEDDAITLNDFSDKVDDNMRVRIDAEVENIRNGHDVFSNLIVDTDGNIRCNEGESFSDDYLMQQFDWFVDGVAEYE